MIHETTNYQIEAQIRDLRVRAQALGAGEVVYAGAPPKFWTAILDQAEAVGTVLVLGKAGRRPVLVLTLPAAEALAGEVGSRRAEGAE